MGVCRPAMGEDRLVGEGRGRRRWWWAGAEERAEEEMKGGTVMW